MRPRTVLISLLIAASVLVDLAALEAASNHPQLPAASALLASLAFSQVALVALWAGLGRTWVYVRLTAMLGVCWLLSRMFGARAAEVREAYYDEPEVQGAWLIALIFESLTIVVVLWNWRVYGLRLVTSAMDAAVANRGPKGRPQFRIVDFLGTTFVVGVLLAMFRQIAAIEPDWPTLPLVLVVLMSSPIAMIATALSAMSLLFAWLLLRRSEPYSRLMALAASLLVGGGLGFVSIIWSQAGPLLGSPTLFLATTTILLVGSLVVIRVAGYRLVTSHRSTEPIGVRSAIATP